MNPFAEANSKLTFDAGQMFRWYQAENENLKIALIEERKRFQTSQEGRYQDRISFTLKLKAAAQEAPEAIKNELKFYKDAHARSNALNLKKQKKLDKIRALFLAIAAVFDD